MPAQLSDQTRIKVLENTVADLQRELAKLRAGMAARLNQDAIWPVVKYDIRVGGGIVVGSQSTNYDPEQGDLHMAGGLIVGSPNTAYNPESGDAHFNGGIAVGSYDPAVMQPGQGEIFYSYNLRPVRSSVSYTGYIFVPLTTVKTSTSWDGDSKSTTPATWMDLSAVFGVPANIKAVLMYVQARDSASSGNDCFMAFCPNNSMSYGPAISCSGLGNDKINRELLVVPCDAAGDLYYSITATGTNTFDVWIGIWGYWI